ncbi:histidine phosphatase family protein [Plectonema cf. radiosum LEGE 06105]|uniref:Histidine phosphatase family protein n=1 Tax=Plectonema cf. radiosum LEGE 06105 TaxID=945769 RepID=A0A8J7F7K3_9CYAN|nr:histidine phosphatase family protein [Plectonema radiosum]MBE9215585.1 histidine phosphatase family protein [Plectonema cf. radiosum LEGE 06105]
MSFNQTRVILVRHGRSTYNDQQRYQGCCDESVLTEQGKQQAFQTGIALSQINFDAIYASPLKRTQETAKEILRVTNSSAQLHLNSNLKEVDLPGWQGLEYKYVRQDLKQEYQIWEESPQEFAIETIESNGQTLVKTKIKPVLQLYEKARQFWQEILPLHQGKTVLIVSHGGTIRALISTATGIKADHYHAIQQSNSGISIIDFENTSLSNAKIAAINLTQHLGEVLPKLKNGKHGLRLLLLPVNSQNHQTNDGTEKITNFLKNVELDFCLNHDISNAQSIVESIIESQSNTPVHLQVSRQDFLDTWHQQISKRSLDYHGLSTGLIVADTNTISTTLNQILELESTTSLQINPGEISILFYPTSQNKPVLQAMNINGTF